MSEGCQTFLLLFVLLQCFGCIMSIIRGYLDEFNIEIKDFTRLKLIGFIILTIVFPIAVIITYICMGFKKLWSSIYYSSFDHVWSDGRNRFVANEKSSKLYKWLHSKPFKE